MKIAILGAGNVATHLALALTKAHFEVTHIYTRRLGAASSLCNMVNDEASRLYQQLQDETTAFLCQEVNSLVDIEGADVWFFCLSDTGLQEVTSQLRTLVAKGELSYMQNVVCIHTAGSLPLDIFQGITEHRGVIYPLQTFSKQRVLDFSQIPLFVEYDRWQPGLGYIIQKRLPAESVVQTIAFALSKKVQFLSTDQRKWLHLAAVYACNFPNYLFGLASQHLAKAGVPSDALRPLIEETVSKFFDLGAEKAQTGAARRGDQAVLQKHLDLIGKNHPQERELYTLLSQLIALDAPSH